MPDDMDRAQEREQEMRQDALAEQSRRTQMMQAGDSAEFCVLCETEIPQGRRMAVPGVQTCIECQTDLEKAVA
ncbi:TraR/DksA C4-type zinc finger protein [Azonexus sp. R2A61]|uniref:TraR/DksA C4-type zinc finger protein n=1 Tax=Azonexus sp. R2A61 TaxID=2744443 RepID=UPI001F2F652E|nr:TraR/DksA C4-type zinc finger protein [Azonexus sp. R2A61]